MGLLENVLTASIRDEKPVKIPKWIKRKHIDRRSYKQSKVYMFI